MFFKQSKARHLIKRLNHLIMTCPVKETKALRIFMNESDLKLLEALCDMDETDLLLYNIPIQVTDVHTPVLEIQGLQ